MTWLGLDARLLTTSCTVRKAGPPQCRTVGLSISHQHDQHLTPQTHYLFVDNQRPHPYHCCHQPSLAETRLNPLIQTRPRTLIHRDDHRESMLAAMIDKLEELLISP